MLSEFFFLNDNILLSCPNKIIRVDRRELKFAIVGCGRIAQRHAKQIQVNGKLQAVCDVVCSKADELGKQRQAELLQNSYAGILGRTIEPVLKPLGFDWKIGIALITSFAAREVFVGTMATLYSVEGGKNADKQTLREKMGAAVLENGKPVYTLASGLSLMIFYVLAMQCMSTLAVVKRETRSWKWPLIQLTYMTLLAYGMSLLTFQLLK